MKIANLLAGVLVLLFSTQISIAQTATPEQQAISLKLMAEINDGLRCGANLIVLKQKLDAAEVRIKDLTEKYEPKAEPKK